MPSSRCSNLQPRFKASVVVSSLTVCLRLATTSLRVITFQLTLILHSTASSASNAFPRALAASSLLATSSSNIKCWKTRIIQCLRNFFPERARIAPDGKRYRDGEAADNYLALYRVPMHQLFDGIDTEGNLPQVMLVPGAVASQDPTTLRYPVKIVVCCNSQSTYDALAQFMQIGAMHDVPNLRITCTVFVEHPDLFCANLQKRAGETRKAWCIEDSA